MSRPFITIIMTQRMKVMHGTVFVLDRAQLPYNRVQPENIFINWSVDMRQ